MKISEGSQADSNMSTSQKITRKK